MADVMHLRVLCRIQTRHRPATLGGADGTSFESNSARRSAMQTRAASDFQERLRAALAASRLEEVSLSKAPAAAVPGGSMAHPEAACDTTQ